MFRMVAFLLLFFTTPAAALTINHNVNDMRPIQALRLDLEMTGPIEAGAADDLASVLASYADSDFREINITLNSPGGNLYEGLRIARILADRPEIVTTQVGTISTPTAICASACVMIFLGADLRYMGPWGRIGVHQFYDPTGEASGDIAMDLAQRYSSEITALMQKQRVDLAFFERMTLTPVGIDWVPQEDLEAWRVVTGSVFDERMEYKNINGRVGLHIIHESLYGTNQMTLYCDGGMIAYAVLEEPEVAMIGSLAFVLDGHDHEIYDYNIVNRDNARTRVLFRVPSDLLPRFQSARTIGARMMLPSQQAFWGFEQTITDDRVSEMARSCSYSPRTQSRAPTMIEHDATDFFGGDLTQDGIRGISFEQCKQICIGNEDCHAVSYVRSQNWCWPKGAVLDRRVNQDVISATKP